MTKLSLVEMDDLRKCEAVIEKSKQGFLDVAVALTKIREKKLYREKHDTFEQYCQSKWGFGKSYANMLIAAGAVVEALPKHLATTVATPLAARTLVKVPEAHRVEVVEEIKKKGQPATAKSITVEAKRVEAAKPITLLDDMGFPIPERAKKTWERRQEIQDILTGLTKLKSKLAIASDDKDTLFASINFNSAMAHLDQLFADIKRAKPYAVCPACQGKLPDKCGLCKGSGIVGKFGYDNADPKWKKARESQIK